MSRDIYPDSLAERFKESAGKKWRPSNGTEGEIFMSAWCYECVLDGDCRILRNTFLYDEDDERYPAEWRINEDGQPECTAFQQ